jgi:hypothetical protein
MTSRTTSRIRGTTWAFAALALISFCWLGFAVTKFSTIFQGLRVPLPIDLRLVVTCGPVGLPVLGIVVAGLIILSDVFLRRRWLPTALACVSMIVALMVFRVLTTPIWAMTSTIER